MNKQLLRHWYVAGIFLLWLVVFPPGCGGKEKIKETPKEGFAKIFAVYIKRDGNKQADIVLRRVYKNIKYDSVAKKDVIVYDTAYGYPVIIKQVDSVGNILKTVDGKDSINVNPVYIPIGRDSVNWRVQGISLDSLLRK